LLLPDRDRDVTREVLTRSEVYRVAQRTEQYEQEHVDVSTIYLNGEIDAGLVFLWSWRDSPVVGPE